MEPKGTSAKKKVVIVGGVAGGHRVRRVCTDWTRMSRF